MRENVKICTAEDVPALAAVENACFSRPLSEGQIRSLIQSENTVFLGTREGERLVGSVWVQIVLDEGYIGNVAVLPECRRRGLADGLLRALDELARDRGLRFLTLEVRAGNTPAIRLYEKNGYLRAGFRPGYYSAPKEDAVLMTKEFEHDE
ncbi:MAG: ribosomal protein S18-alanine N-acetyltransferase [Oscillospiraceae bacterium]|nr:ribosomal protein S18-alanine N-acetyltransferase [Oscillospiraceae bacterium]